MIQYSNDCQCLDCLHKRYPVINEADQTFPQNDLANCANHPHNIQPISRQSTLEIPSTYWNEPDKMQNDTPKHYQGKVQPVDLIDAFNLSWDLGNVVKYCTRAKFKGDELGDLKKAKYYLDKAILKAEESKYKKHPLTPNECYECK